MILKVNDHVLGIEAIWISRYAIPPVPLPNPPDVLPNKPPDTLFALFKPKAVVFVDPKADMEEISR